MSRTIFGYRQTTAFFGLIAAALLVGTASLGQAQFPGWNVPSGNWSVASNWANGSPTDYAYITNGGTCTIASSDGVAATLDLYLGNATGNGWINMTGGSLEGSDSFPITEQLGTAAGSGVFTQTGGINYPFLAHSKDYGYSTLMLGYSKGGYGEYDMGGGSLDVNAIYVGASNYATASGTGAFTQTGGSIGAFSTETTNAAIGIFVGGSWAAKPITGESGLGTYNLQNGLIVGGCESVGADATGTFTQSGGTNAFVGGGEYNSTNMADYNNYFGALFIGIRGTASKGYGNGTYNLSGGLLTGFAPAGVSSSDGEEDIGIAGTGTFNQTGGTNHCRNYLSVASPSGGGFNWGSGGQGFYNLSGNGLVTGAAHEYVGTAGTGIFTQTGGTNAAGSVTLGAAGTYNLNGGLLSLSSDLSSSGNNATFSFTAGTLQASAGTLSNGMSLTVGTAVSNVATVDANGQAILLNGGAYSGLCAISGTGQLVVIDSVDGGTVVLGNSGTLAANTYLGGTTVLSGTLELVSSEALPSTGILTVGGPTAVVLSVQAGTLFGSDAVGQSAVDGGVEIASSNPAADGSGSPSPGVASGLGMVPAASGPAAVPEPSTWALLGAGFLSLLALAWRRRRAG